MPALCEIVDCPEASLGTLGAPPLFPAANTNEKMVNGVVIPQNVIDQLDRLGIALTWYTPGELEAAVESCAVDCTLIDDPDGTDFMDELSKTEDEIEADDGEIDEPWRANDDHVKAPEISDNPFYPGFRTRLKHERHHAMNDDDDAQLGSH